MTVGDGMSLGLPNLLTLSRVAIIPVFVAAFFLPGAAADWATFALFVAASTTDWLDGWLARRQGRVSSFGRFLDPVADKLLVAAALVMLVALGRAPVLAALIILCREILVSGLREFLAGREVLVPVSRLAKWKTAVQMGSLCVLLVAGAAPDFGVEVEAARNLGAGLLWLAATLTAITGYDYLRVGLRRIADGDPPTPEPAGRP
jgi:cardiolipin synthase